MKRIIHFSGIALISLGLTSTAMAANCNPSALNGKWFGSLSIVNAPVSTNGFSAYCEVNFTKGGTTGSCVTLSSNPLIDGKTDTISGSNLTVEKDCSVNGSVNWALGGTSEIHGHINTPRNVFVAAFHRVGLASSGISGTLSLVK